MSALDAAARTSRAATTGAEITRAIGRLSGASKLRCAIVSVAAGAASYVAIERALPAETRAVAGFAVVVLILLLITAFALPFRK
jgi:hypothetical protein